MSDTQVTYRFGNIGKVTLGDCGLSIYDADGELLLTAQAPWEKVKNGEKEDSRPGVLEYEVGRSGFGVCTTVSGEQLLRLVSNHNYVQTGER